MKSDVRNMGVKYEKEKVELDKRWQEMLNSTQRERDEAERGRHRRIGTIRPRKSNRH